MVTHTFTGPQYRLWAEAIDVKQHSSYDEHPQGSYFSAMQGRAHSVRKSSSSDPRMFINSPSILLHNIMFNH